jgi:hypothetical protein
LNREKLTAMLSHETGSCAGAESTLETADFLADTVIRLGAKTRGGRLYRSIEIIKSRGQDYDAGEHTLQMTETSLPCLDCRSPETLNSGAIRSVIQYSQSPGTNIHRVQGHQKRRFSTGFYVQLSKNRNSGSAFCRIP